MSAPPAPTGVAAPICVLGAMAATCAAMVMKVPAEAARAALYQGKENIYLASELLGGGVGPAPAGEEPKEAAEADPQDQPGSTQD